MSTKEISILNIFTVLILMAMPVSSTYAKTLDGLLNGVYASNEQWTCASSAPPLVIPCLSATCFTETITIAGEIIYDGHGGAEGNGRWNVTTNSTVKTGDIGTYLCDWTYEVLDDWTFDLFGDCTVVSLQNPETLFHIEDQKWVGRISNKGETLLIDRHDFPDGSDFDPYENVALTENSVDIIIERLCGKTGVHIKLR